MEPSSHVMVLLFDVARAMALSTLFLSAPVASSPLVERSSSSSAPVNKGLVAFGLIPSNARDSTGTTIGGIGSAIALKRGSFAQTKNGSFTGTLVVQPDRGYNVETTVDFQGRQHEIPFTLNPYYGSANLSFADALGTLTLAYKQTLLYTERQGKKTTGLDALGVRPKDKQDPKLPIPNLQTNNRLTLDSEALVLNKDGSFWVGDEYGAYIYKFNGDGSLNSVIKPPEAVVPHLDGHVNFTSQTDPDTGRAPNQGFEAVTASPDGKTLYAMLQSALIQDGGNGDNNRYARFFQWDVSGNTPNYKHEYVVPLPTSSSGKVYAQSDIHYIDGNQFLILARDGHGHGDSNTLSTYKSVDIFDISKADDIANSKYDKKAGAVAPNGTLVSSVTPATYTPFVSLIDPIQLGRFSLHNGGANDSQLIDAKWESSALAPCFDDANPNDYFLFVASDNDFITTDGTMPGQPYNAGEDVDNQFMVWRVTLPTAPKGSVAQFIGI